MATSITDLEHELAGVQAIAAGLGEALYVAQLGIAARFNGADELHARALALLEPDDSAAAAPNPPGCGCRNENPPRSSLKQLGGKGVGIARAALARAITRAQSTPTKLVVGTLGTIAVWDLLVPDEAVEVQRVISGHEVMAEQFRRMSPEDALAAYQKVAKANGQGGGIGDLLGNAGSLIQWGAIALGVWIIGVPIAKAVIRSAK